MPRGRQEPGHTAEGLQPAWSDARSAPSPVWGNTHIRLPQFPHRTILSTLLRTLIQPGVPELL